MSDAAMSDGDRLRDVVHDVAKYLTRMVRNLPPEGEVPEVLAAMLEKDLYETHRGLPASARFDELADAVDDPEVRSSLRSVLAEIDALRDRVRARDAGAMRRAAALALEFDRVLAAFVDGRS